MTAPKIVNRTELVLRSGEVIDMELLHRFVSVFPPGAKVTCIISVIASDRPWELSTATAKLQAEWEPPKPPHRSWNGQDRG